MKAILTATAILASWSLALTDGMCQTKPKSTWKHSCYVYRDTNRNGSFDLGDKPYANLQVEITRPDGSKAAIKSNIDGFANFTVSLGNTEMGHIFEPGVHRVRAVFPPGWHSTSDQKMQIYEFAVKPEAGGGLIPLRTCRPIGVAPVLHLSGQFVTPNGTSRAEYRLQALNPQGGTRILTLDNNGRFGLVATPGEWTIRVLDRGGKVALQRQTTITNSAVVLSRMHPNMNNVPKPEISVSQVGFDDLIVADALFEIPNGYGGLNWLNWIAVHNRFYRGAGYVNATVSSEYVAYNSSGVPAVMSRAKPFDFIGSFISVAWPRGEEADVIVKAWRRDILVYQDLLRLSVDGPVYFHADYRAITRLEFSSGNYERIVLDDFQYLK